LEGRTDVPSGDGRVGKGQDVGKVVWGSRGRVRRDDEARMGEVWVGDEDS
jgi:hypothetical protein